MRRAILAVILLLCAGFFVPTPPAANAQSQSGNVTVGAIVSGPPPSQPPTIDQPLSGTVFTEQQIEIKGSCLDGLIVKIFRNNIFGGSALCSSSNTYTITMDLFEDQNDLVARQYDFLEQASPDSNLVTVFYNPPSPPPGDEETTTANFSLIIDYNYNFQGVFVGEPFHLPVHFIGGTGPYAVSITWGDGNTSVFSREDTEQFYADHTYEEPGAYTIEIRVSDSGGQEAYLQFVLIVNGGISKAEPVPSSGGNGETGSGPNLSWPEAVTTLVVTGGASFAAGFTLAFFWDKLPAAWEKFKLKLRGPKP